MSPLLVVAAAFAYYPAFVCVDCNKLFTESKVFRMG